MGWVNSRRTGHRVSVLYDTKVEFRDRLLFNASVNPLICITKDVFRTENGVFSNCDDADIQGCGFYSTTRLLTSCNSTLD